MKKVKEFFWNEDIKQVGFIGFSVIAMLLIFLLLAGLFSLASHFTLIAIVLACFGFIGIGLMSLAIILVVYSTIATTIVLAVSKIKHLFKKDD